MGETVVLAWPLLSGVATGFHDRSKRPAALVGHTDLSLSTLAVESQTYMKPLGRIVCVVFVCVRVCVHVWFRSHHS